MSAYYYAAGQKVTLEPDEQHLAVDRNAAKEAGLDARIGATVVAAAVRAGADVLVTPRSSLTADMIKQLQDAGALQPVYKYNQATIVAMPEVRVEFDTPEQRQSVKDLLSSKTSDVEITEDTPDRMVLRPVSGRGEDALSLANRIHENASPAAVSPRFVQFVPRPKT
jgi:hypothetical protein